MAVVYAYLDGWKAAADAFKADLKAAADSVRADLNSPLEGVFEGRPRAYGGEYPVWVLYGLTSRGQCPYAERFMPAEMIAQILVLTPETAPPSTSKSGRGYAEDVTFEGFSAWIDRLWDQGLVQSRATGIIVSSTAIGAEDEFGRVFFRGARNNILWAHSAEVVATL